MKLTPQQERVLTHLKRKGSIQPLEAWIELGIYRLSDVIFKLRENFKIDTQMTKTKNRYDENVTYAIYIFRGEK